MAVSADLEAFFAKMANLGVVVAYGQPKLDLDLYISNYRGHARFDRLLHIGCSSVLLCVDALKAAVAEAKQGRDTDRYKQAWDAIRVAAPGEPEAQRDDAWIEATESRNEKETEHLEAELKGYRNNLIKESIRMGNEDLGKHLEATGKLVEAVEAYSRMRNDISTSRHIIDCSRHVISASLQRRDWTLVLSSVSKMSAVVSEVEDKAEVSPVQTYSRVVSGIAHLGMERFYEAAVNFTKATLDAAPGSVSMLLSPNDLAIYGGLLSLATMDRKELQSRLLDSPTFRTSLECEPSIRRAITMFINGRYASCLDILESSWTDFALDIHLNRHLPNIFSRIRRKCIVQYFTPFSCVTLANLESAFGRPEKPLMDELVAMIRDGTLEARIDMKEKVVLAVQKDPRAEMQRKALAVAHRYEAEATERLRRMSIIAAGLEVSGGKGKTFDDDWLDESIQGAIQESLQEGIPATQGSS